jgi:hypothetical protein
MVSAKKAQTEKRKSFFLEESAVCSLGGCEHGMVNEKQLPGLSGAKR